jgi:hypothetical protein
MWLLWKIGAQAIHSEYWRMTRAELHDLVDRLPEAELAQVEFMLRSMNAPVDDEPVTEDDRAAMEQARRELAAGQTAHWVPPGYFR